ncbi:MULTISPECIES: single-stranded DNA-binding protein [unclassified Streptomyces]|uniref:single-stranded DNA-binding protein n=1 Tax=unclassified Streptomyces TaxID=2593676 RepID=UPI00099EDCE6|nr:MULTISPECIES: single-stranded DNA-binding protein [unclassified Streptomyces]
MNETTVTLVGNVATAVEYRDTATGGVARFRFAVPTRRWDRVQELWSDGPTSFYTVSAWRSLGANLAASVSVGEPLVVHGRLRVREDERDGQRKTFVDVAALAVGHDLSRGTSAFRRAARQEQRPEPAAGVEPGAAGTAARTGLTRDPVVGSTRDPAPRPTLRQANAEPDPWAVAAEDAEGVGGAVAGAVTEAVAGAGARLVTAP